MFSCEFCEISKNTFFAEHPWATASVRWFTDVIGTFPFLKYLDDICLLCLQFQENIFDTPNSVLLLHTFINLSGTYKK